MMETEKFKPNEGKKRNFIILYKTVPEYVAFRVSFSLFMLIQVLCYSHNENPKDQLSKDVR